MGIDFERFRLKADVDRSNLESLIEQQTVSFQSMWGWNSDATSDVEPVHRQLRERLHLQRYHAASGALREQIITPEWDDENDCPADIPDFVTCWRVYPISKSPIFPPLWRVASQRTYLPDQLASQLTVWKNWTSEVQAGKHEEYLRSIHTHLLSDFQRHHWTRLRELAAASLLKTTNWSQKPRLVEVRQQILNLPEPTIIDAPIEPPGTKDNHIDSATHQTRIDEVQSLIHLTRQWDRNVRDSWKLKYYEDLYELSLDQMKARACDEWLDEFFGWVDRCVDHGFGLFLSY